MSDFAKHAETPLGTPTTSRGNPVSRSLNVVVSVPESIEVRMVDASALSDYEVWFFISSILASAVIGFLVAFIQALNVNATNSVQLGYTTLVFFIIFVVALVTTLCKRHVLRRKGRSIRLKATDDIMEE